MTIIGLKELREQTESVAERISHGETFMVVKRSKPIFRLMPVTDAATAKDELTAWTATAIERYRPALKALADK
jgi:antitoxin (DNA-binding transcriptional repressor) of toxin-antitoxin stability system